MLGPVPAAICCVDLRIVLMHLRALGATASTSVTCSASGSAGAREKSGYLAERPSGRLAGTAVLLDLEIDFLAFSQARHACALNSGNVDENVRTAVAWLDEAEALGAIEPFNGTGCHMRIPSKFATWLI
jgi:hypothetical protein